MVLIMRCATLEGDTRTQVGDLSFSAQYLAEEHQTVVSRSTLRWKDKGMKRASLLFALFAGLLWIPWLSATAGDLIYSQLVDGQSTYGPSQLWSANSVNSEVADEFNLVANIDRVSAAGFSWGPVEFQGAYVRFYQFGADNKPGALEKEYFFAAGNPAIVFTENGGLDATLSPAFTATGRHFLSIQPVTNYWYWWSSGSGSPRGEAFYFRDNALGEGWHHGDNLNISINADVAFDLYGTVTGAGVITSLSANTLPRSGFLEIFGSNFGGSGTVLIGELNAPVADWSSNRIVAYVPESAPFESLPVQVISDGGASNTLPLVVTARPSAGEHVNWRFRMNGPYSFVRPAIGSDGTIYCIDGFGHLYSLTPDGGLKWLVRGAGDKGVAVGPNETIYVASEDFIKAFNPDGSEQWTFVQTPRAFICLGVAVGPDDNIYSVSTEGLGVFSLTPAGVLRWTNEELYRRPIVTYGEIVFGPNGGNDQLYFYANDHFRAVSLDGSSVFTNSSGQIAQMKPGLQPAVAPDGSVHTVLSAFSPAGSLLWFFQTPYPYNVFTPADIGNDGTHYFVQNLSQLFALNPDGSQRLHAVVNGYVDGPVVDSLNTQLVMGSQETGDHAGFIVSVGAQDATERWRVILPLEDPTIWNPGVGIFGFNQFVNTRGRFTADGRTVYFVTATATGDNNTSKSFVYSLDAGSGGPPPTPTPVGTPMATPTPGPTASSTQTPGPSATPVVTPTPSTTPISAGPPKAINLSTRLRVRTGDDVGIGGLIVTGNAPKRVLIRAIGPSLVDFGIQDVLADPVLELHGPGSFATVINQNWRDTQEAEIDATGIAPIDDREPAIVATLMPGAYTAIVKGIDNTTGVALVEVYDLEPAVDSQLANLSTRAFVSVGDNIVIAGFSLSGNSGDGQVIVRGMGPSLAAMGVSNTLADPMLELRNGDGNLVAADNNWQENSVQASDMIAANLAPASQSESGISASLPPGLYTALLSGVDRGTGVGVVEIYERDQAP